MKIIQKDDYKLEEETKKEDAKEVKKVYSREELSKMLFPEKQRIARELGFSVLWLTEEELDSILSGETKTGGIRYARAEVMGLNEGDIKELQRKREAVPRDTYIPKKDYEDWMKIIAKNPMAFNGIDLTDKKAETVHILDKYRNHVECACGAVFSIPERDMNGNPIFEYPCPGVVKKVRLPKGGFKEVRVCLGEGKFRMYQIHKVPED